MGVTFLSSEPPNNKFAPSVIAPMYKVTEGSDDFIDTLIAQVLLYEKQVVNEELVTEVYKHEEDPYEYTQHWKQHSLFWDCSALAGEHLTRFEMTPELAKLFHIIRKQYLLFLKEMNYPRIKVHINIWANVLRAGQWISKHLHQADANSYLSGTYYLTTNDTYLKLINPIRIDHMNIVSTKKGTLLFFPSYLPHESTIYEETDLRISIAFDIIVDESIKDNPWRPCCLLDDPSTMEGIEMYYKDRTLTA